MIVVRLKGGLGNQMFQYALGHVLAIKNNTELKVNTLYLDLNSKNITKRTLDLDVFNVNLNILESKDLPFIYRFHKYKMFILISFLFKKILKPKGIEQNFAFNEEFLDLKGDTYLDGYFQSPKYFKGYEDVIRKDFTFKNNFTKNILDLSGEIKNTHSLCVHFRRTDYVNNKNHDVVDMDYYIRGIGYIKNKSKIDKIYVFSDDITWCKENLKFDIPTFFVGDEYVGDKNSGHLFLMSQCHNFVIANSSFSWWAAWLANHPGKMVVAPKQWFGDSNIDTSDLIPDDWIRI